MEKIIFFVILFFCVAPNVFSAEISGMVILRDISSEGKTRPAAESIVFLEAVPKGAAFEAAKQKLEAHPKMASQDKQFLPQVLPILEGAAVEFPNNDRILHNVFSLSKTKPFDFGLYGKGISKSSKFDKSGLVKVYCNIHEAMVGYILILENPFFTRVGEDGTFKLSGVPDGKFKLVAWHRHSSSTVSKDVILGQTKDISVVGGKNAGVSFELAEDNVGTKHKNKWGKEYKDKY